MPLHLLGKKSWNVYNAANIARVRRDEAGAKAAEEAEEQRMQEVDAQRRLAILRGELPPPTEDDFHPAAEDLSNRSSQPYARAQDPAHARDTSARKRRKRAGEDDTDFELRLARERNADGGADDNNGSRHKSSRSVRLPPASLVDDGGHISLFGDKRARAHAEKNDEAQAEARKKQRELEDQYTMRFANAAGRNGEGLSRPWYSQADGSAPDASCKDVWGNEDAGRRQRDARRIVSDDPLTMMRKGASQVRELKRERKRVQDERDEELRQLKREEREERKERKEREGMKEREERQGHRERRRRRDEDDGEGRHSGGGSLHEGRERGRRRRSRSRSADDGHDRRDSHRERRRRHDDDRHGRRRGSRSRSRSRSPRQDATERVHRGR